MSPDKLLRLLSVPGTDIPPEFKVEQFADGVPQSGWLLHPDGTVVARLDDFRFDFVHFDARAEAERARACVQPRPATARPELVPVDLRSSRLERCGDWYWLTDWLLGHNGDQPDALLRFCSTAPTVIVKFVAHGWSGIARVAVDGIPLCEMDLFNQEASIPRPLKINNPERRNILVEIAPTGRSAPKAQGRQCIIEAILEANGSPAVPRYAKPAPVNRGSPFPEAVTDMLRDVPPDGVLLDIGGGQRQIADSRYINLEYGPYDEPDLLADGLALPFRAEAVDCVFSSAVMEHVRDPHRFGAEIWRVLKPGGRIIVNSAFMQPVHSEGQHFFNATPYAMDLVFERFESRRVWWFGAMSHTVEWMLKVSGAAALADPEEYAAVMASLRRFDALISYDKLMYVAGGVWIEARKPSATLG